MPKKDCLLAIVSFLQIPAVTVLGAAPINAIDPELAASHADYERNYRLLVLAKNLLRLAGLVAITTLWFLTCFFC